MTTSYRVDVTIPNHRDAPGQVVEAHRFDRKADAVAYVADLERTVHYRGVLVAEKAAR